jgi:hypothetical protein
LANETLVEMGEKARSDVGARVEERLAEFILRKL